VRALLRFLSKKSFYPDLETCKNRVAVDNPYPLA
jgi:hypothetical protein